MGQIKNKRLLDRNHLAGPNGDAISVFLCAEDRTMRLLTRWLRSLALLILTEILRSPPDPPQSSTTGCRPMMLNTAKLTVDSLDTRIDPISINLQGIWERAISTAYL